MKLISFLTLIILFISISCTYRPQEEKKPIANEKVDSIQVVRKPFENNPDLIEYEIPVYRGTQMKHGVQKRFYRHGSLYSAIPYDHGIKVGTAYTYYPAAEGKEPVVWKEQPYKKNKLDGICKRFHKDGTLQAEYEYKNGMPATGLKEFSQTGKEIKLPSIKVSQNRIHDGVLITASLSNGASEVDYFMGNLVDGKYMPKGLKALQVRKGVGEVVYRGTSKTVTITAVYSTRYRNKYLVSKTISIN